jgi:histidine ammonia-lyase
MGSISAVKLLAVLRNVEQVLAVELLTASQALDFRSPLKPGAGVLAAHRFLRRQMPHADRDYEVRNDLAHCAALLRTGDLLREVERVAPELA